MKTKILIALLLFVNLSVFSQTAKKRESKSDFVEISTPADFLKINDNPTASYIMKNDIDFEGRYINSLNRFSGIFDGNGFTIRNFKIEEYPPEKSNISISVGFFSKLINATVKNLKIENATIIGDNTVNYPTADKDVNGKTIYYESGFGGLVGMAYSSTIENVSFSGSVTGKDNVGGLVGYGDGEYKVISSSANAKVVGEKYVGGLVGRSDTVMANDSLITSSYVKGNVIGKDNVGGLIGYVYHQIVSSYAMANVSGEKNVGGLIGDCENAGVRNSYALGNVVGKENVGGFIGTNSCNVIYSYERGTVSGETNVGGFTGYNRSNITSSLATGNVTGQTNVGGLVGENRIDIRSSLATGNVTGENNVGGLVGFNNGRIKSSYITGLVVATESCAGGIVGKNGTESYIEIFGSYSLSKSVKAKAHAGTFAGKIISQEDIYGNYALPLEGMDFIECISESCDSYIQTDDSVTIKKGVLPDKFEEEEWIIEPDFYPLLKNVNIAFQKEIQ